MNESYQHHTNTDYKFAPIPEAIIGDAAVSHAAVRVYAALMRRGLDPSSCFPSYRRIGEDTGIAQRSVPALIKCLESAGWIEITARFKSNGEQDSNGYMIRTTRVSNAPPTRGNVDPLRVDARLTKAIERESSNDDARDVALSSQQALDVGSENTEVRDDNEVIASRGSKTRSKTRAKKEQTPERAQAIEIVNAWWEDHKKKNNGEAPTAQPYIAIVKIVEALLKAGRGQAEIKRAMLKVETVSTRTMEVAITRDRQQRVTTTTASRNGAGEKPMPVPADFWPYPDTLPTEGTPERDQFEIYAEAYYDGLEAREPWAVKLAREVDRRNAV